MEDEPEKKPGQTPPDPHGGRPRPEPDTKRDPAPDTERPKDEEFPIEKKIRAI